MEPLVAVFDANVLVPAAPRDTLLRTAELGLIRPVWSEQLLSEVQRNIVKAARIDARRARQLVSVLQAAFPDAMVTGYEPLIEGLSNALEDRHVLAAAVAACATVIVTENLSDFPEAALAPHNVVALSIDGFLSHLFALDPEGMAEIIALQSADLSNPPISIDQLLAYLARWAPAFVRSMRGYLTMR